MNCKDIGFSRRQGPLITVVNDTEKHRGVTWMNLGYVAKDSQTAFLPPGALMSYKFKYKPGHKGSILCVQVGDDFGFSKICSVEEGATLYVEDILNQSCKQHPHA